MSLSKPGLERETFATAVCVVYWNMVKLKIIVEANLVEIVV